MFGPKLDARSYTHLLLIVIASLLTLNLIAQGTRSRDALQTDNQRSSAYRGSEFTSEADATQALADATRDVAAANRDIANALNKISSSISKLELSVVVNNDSRSNNRTAAPATVDNNDAGPTGAISPPSAGLTFTDEEPSVQGTIDIN